MMSPVAGDTKELNGTLVDLLPRFPYLREAFDVQENV